MKRVYFVRHGESTFNAGGPILPEDEILLSEKGKEQARFLGQRASKLPIDVIIASSIRRARDTAHYIAEAVNKPIETSDLFIERVHPSGQHGLPSDHPMVQEITRNLMERFGDESYRHSDEEDFESMKKRAIAGLDLLRSRPEENILVVTHGIFLRVLLAVALYGEKLTQFEAGRIAKAFKTKNTGLSLLEYGAMHEGNAPEWSVRTWNDHAHLG